MVFKLVLVMLFGHFISEQVHAQNYSLNQLYQKALEKKEFSQINKGIEGAARSRKSQANSYLLPTIIASGTYEKSRFESDNAAIGTSNDEIKYGAITLRQNLFKGGTISGIQREKKNLEVAKAEVALRNLDLYESIAVSYYRINTLESFLVVLKDLEKVSDRRVKVLKNRVSIGKSRTTDQLTNEIQNQNLKTQIQQTITDLNNEREYLSLLTALPKDIKLSPDIQVPTLKTLDFYISKINSNPEVLKQKGLSEVAKYNQEVMTAQHYPTLYADLQVQKGEFAAGREGADYSGMLKLEIPLFEGGRTSAAAQEAKYLALIESQRYSLILSGKQVEIKNEYENLKKWLELLRIAEETTKIAERNYKLFNRELELGLVSNLDLLNSLDSYVESKKNRDEAFYQMKLSEIRLSRLIGEKRI